MNQWIDVKLIERMTHLDVIAYKVPSNINSRVGCYHIHNLTLTYFSDQNYVKLEFDINEDNSYSKYIFNNYDMFFFRQGDTTGYVYLDPHIPLLILHNDNQHYNHDMVTPVNDDKEKVKTDNLSDYEFFVRGF